MRQLEGEQNNLRELLEEEEESKRNVEKQVSTLQCQVSPPCRPLEALMCGVEILRHVPLWFMRKFAQWANWVLLPCRCACLSSWQT